MNNIIHRKKSEFFAVILLIAACYGSLAGQTGMALIPAGGASFQQGSTAGNDNEQPVHTVTFTCDFWMDTTEVTQAAYQTLMSSAYPDYDDLDWVNPYGVGDDHPAYLIEWGDAALYCNARSQAAGLDTVYSYSGISGAPGSGCALIDVTVDYAAHGCRLPTEAEWEFACRAGSTSEFYWGQDYDPYPANASDSAEVGTYAVWAGNSWDLSSDHTDFGCAPVASKMPNAFGLYDMSGNLSEWINDWYEDYSAAAVTDPTGSTEETYHSVRGGNWGNSAFYLRSASRNFASPDYYIYFVGFRTVLPANAAATDGDRSTLPGDFELWPNYPNPFNPATTIIFTLPAATPVTLTVYNLTGQVVAELLRDRDLGSGSHSVVFDGSGLPSGLYFYRLAGNGVTTTRSMLLLK